MQQQQTNLWDRLLEQPIVLAILGTVLSMYIIGTLEERRQRREKDKDPSQVAPSFISENDKKLWEKFRELYRQEMANPEKATVERIDLLSENLDHLQASVDELLDRTQPSITDEERQELKDATTKQ